MRERDSEVFIVEPDRGSGLGWFVVGAALGAGLALLFAPASGEETRRRLRREAGKLKDRAEDVIDDLSYEYDRVREDVEEKVDEVKEKVTGAARSLVDEARSRKTSVSAARDELERRLADARARRREAVPEDEEPVA
ncbi:MAG TPA: YtxH domain-containing protein [Gemmatimonadales bacterium]